MSVCVCVFALVFSFATAPNFTNSFANVSIVENRCRCGLVVSLKLLFLLSVFQHFLVNGLTSILACLLSISGMQPELHFCPATDGCGRRPGSQPVLPVERWWRTVLVDTNWQLDCEHIEGLVELRDQEIIHAVVGIARDGQHAGLYAIVGVSGQLVPYNQRCGHQ